MDGIYGNFWKRSTKWLKAGWLATAALVAVYIGMIEPREMAREISASKSTGLAAVAGGGSILSVAATPHTRISGGTIHVPASRITNLQRCFSRSFRYHGRAKVGPYFCHKHGCETTCICIKEIRKLAESANGFLVRSQTSGEQGSRYASLEIRIPIARFNEVKAAILKLGVRVESDRLEAQT